MNQALVPAPLSYVPPKWFTESYDGMEADIADDILSAIYHSRLKALNETGKVETQEDAVIASTLIADALMASVEQLDNIDDGAQRAMMRNIWSVHSNNYHRMTKEEYDTPTEWLIDKIPTLKKNDKSTLSNILFLLEHFFPMLEKIGNGWEPEKLLAIRDNWSKARETLPTLRQLLIDLESAPKPIQERIVEQVEKQEKLKMEAMVLEGTPKEEEALKKVEVVGKDIEKLIDKQEKVVEKAQEVFTKEVGRVLDLIADEKVTVNVGPNSVKAILSNPDKKYTVFEGLQAIIPGHTIFYVVVKSGYERTMQSATKNFVNWQVTDPAVIKRDVDKLFKKE